MEELLFMQEDIKRACAQFEVSDIHNPQGLWMPIDDLDDLSICAVLFLVLPHHIGSFASTCPNHRFQRPLWFVHFLPLLRATQTQGNSGPRAGTKPNEGPLLGRRSSRVWLKGRKPYNTTIYVALEYIACRCPSIPIPSCQRRQPLRSGSHYDGVKWMIQWRRLHKYVFFFRPVFTSAKLNRQTKPDRQQQRPHRYRKPGPGELQMWNRFCFHSSIASSPFSSGSSASSIFCAARRPWTPFHSRKLVSQSQKTTREKLIQHRTYLPIAPTASHVPVTTPLIPKLQSGEKKKEEAAISDSINMNDE